MIKLKKLANSPEKIYRELGWEWFLGDGEWKYLTSEIVEVTENETDAFYEAGNELYEMFVEAADHVIDNNLWEEMGIPKNMVELIRYTWNDERHFHLLGRFDFAGGTSGLPIQLLEFNADTPTTLPETSIMQWTQLKANDLDEEQQFNFVYLALVENFKRLKNMNPDLQPKLLLSTLQEAPEDDANVEVIGEAAQEAGFEVEYRYIEEVVFSAEYGIFVEYGDEQYEKFDFWYMLVPWEYIANDEPKLMKMLATMTMNRKVVILNPAYTLLFQSKAIMKYMWDLHKGHTLLLETSFEEIYRYEKYVKKVILGREGDNTTIFNETGIPIAERKGDYGKYKSIYQAYTELDKDEAGKSYQAGVFFAYESCGLGFRRGKLIMDEDAEFLGHRIVEE